MGTVDVYLDTSGGFRRDRLVDPERLLLLPDLVRKNLEGAMRVMAKEVVDEIWFGYVKAIRVRPRVEGEHLLQRLRHALTFTVNTPQREVWLGAFELSVMDRLTRNEGHGTENEGWFSNLEDGRGDAQRHGSRQFAFVERDWAMRLAEDCADEMKASPTDRTRFVQEVGERFKGRHGEGIMVRLDEPLFYEFPQYGRDPGTTTGRGKAGNVVGWHGHPGYPALDVLKKVGRGWTERMKALAVKAVDDAGRSL